MNETKKPASGRRTSTETSPSVKDVQDSIRQKVPKTSKTAASKSSVSAESSKKAVAPFGPGLTVFMLSWEYPPRLIGGISRHVQEISHALVSQGVDVQVITAPHPDTPDYTLDNGVSVHRVNVDLDTSDIVSWVHRLNQAMVEKVDEIMARPEANNSHKNRVMIHAHDWLAAFAAKDLKLKYKLPLISTIHATEYGRNNGLHNDLQRTISHIEWTLAYESWKVICCSWYMQDEINHALGVPRDKMWVIPNGIDSSKFDHEFDREAFRATYAAQDEKIVFFVGRMVREKGAAVLIEAFQRVLNHYNNAKLVIAGGGNRQHLTDLANQLGIGNRVYFTGYVDDETLIRLYLSADVAVFPSLYEPFGIVALEGMAAKVPVVVSDAGGLKEVVNHGITGISTWAGNPESLSWGILQMLHNPENARRMADMAYHKATTDFSWERIAFYTRECYRYALEEFDGSDWAKEDAATPSPNS